mgnify:CR=1 FL=1
MGCMQAVAGGGWGGGVKVSVETCPAVALNLNADGYNNVVTTDQFEIQLELSCVSVLCSIDARISLCVIFVRQDFVKVSHKLLISTFRNTFTIPLI